MFGQNTIRNGVRVFVVACGMAFVSPVVAQDEAFLGMEGPVGIEFQNERVSDSPISGEVLVGDGSSISVEVTEVTLDDRGRVIDGNAVVQVRDSGDNVIMSTTINNVNGQAKFIARTNQDSSAVRNFFVISGRQLDPVPAAFTLVGRGEDLEFTAIDMEDVLQGVRETPMAVEGRVLILDEERNLTGGLVEGTAPGLSPERGFFFIETAEQEERGNVIDWTGSGGLITEASESMPKGLTATPADFRVRVTKSQFEGDLQGFAARAIAPGEAIAIARGTHEFSEGTLDEFESVAEVRDVSFRSPTGSVRTRIFFTEGDRARMRDLTGPWDLDYRVNVDVSGIVDFTEEPDNPLRVNLNFDDAIPGDVLRVFSLEDIGSWIVRFNRIQLRLNLDLGERGGLDFSDVEIVFEARFDPLTNTIRGEIDEINNLPDIDLGGGGIFDDLVDIDIDGSFTLTRRSSE